MAMDSIRRHLLSDASLTEEHDADASGGHELDQAPDSGHGGFGATAGRFTCRRAWSTQDRRRHVRTVNDQGGEADLDDGPAGNGDTLVRREAPTAQSRAVRAAEILD